MHEGKSPSGTASRISHFSCLWQVLPCATFPFWFRLVRVRDSLFTFINYDGIPWNNNMAERALRHLVVQENISKTFYKSVFPDHLLLLGIMQTCRFQEKSFLKFLISEEKDVDSFMQPNEPET
jgi:hypothetical protein